MLELEAVTKEIKQMGYKYNLLNYLEEAQTIEKVETVCVELGDNGDSLFSIFLANWLIFLCIFSDFLFSSILFRPSINFISYCSYISSVSENNST